MKKQVYRQGIIFLLTSLPMQAKGTFTEHLYLVGVGSALAIYSDMYKTLLLYLGKTNTKLHISDKRHSLFAKCSLENT